MSSQSEVHLLRKELHHSSCLFIGTPQSYMKPFNLDELDSWESGVTSASDESDRDNEIKDAFNELNILEMNLSLLRGYPSPSRTNSIKWIVELYQVNNSTYKTYKDMISNPSMYSKPQHQCDIPWSPLIYITNLNVDEFVGFEDEVDQPICIQRFIYKGSPSVYVPLPHQLDDYGIPLYKTGKLARAVLHRMQIIDTMTDSPFTRLARIRLSYELMFDPWDKQNLKKLEYREDPHFGRHDYYYISSNGDIHRHGAHAMQMGSCSYIKLPYNDLSPRSSIPRFLQFDNYDLDVCLNNRFHLDVCSMIGIKPDPSNKIVIKNDRSDAYTDIPTYPIYNPTVSKLSEFQIYRPIGVPPKFSSSDDDATDYRRQHYLCQLRSLKNASLSQ